MCVCTVLLRARTTVGMRIVKHLPHEKCSEVWRNAADNAGSGQSNRAVVLTYVYLTYVAIMIRFAYVFDGHFQLAAPSDIFVAILAVGASAFACKCELIKLSLPLAQIAAFISRFDWLWCRRFYTAPSTKQILYSPFLHIHQFVTIAEYGGMSTYVCDRCCISEWHVNHWHVDHKNL